METTYLLTGRPGTGKTSLVREVVAGLGEKAGGFYTGEMRVRGERFGFKLITLDGQEAALAHVDFQSRYRVGKYGVDIDAVDKAGVPALEEAIREREVIVIDEIGKMELFSDHFREVVWQAIQSGKRVIGTIMLNPHPWAGEVKRQPQVRLVEVTRSSYSRVLVDIKSWLEIK